MKPSHLCRLFIKHTTQAINQTLIKLLSSNFCILQDTSVILSLMYVILHEVEPLQAALKLNLKLFFLTVILHKSIQ